MSGPPDIAFVLPAGGSAGATQVGSLLALLEAGIVPDVLVGCSVGALNATFMAMDPTVARAARLAEVMDGLRDRGLLDASGRFTDAGRATKDRIESLTDVLAEAPYDGLEAGELDELIALLEPIAGALEAAGSR